MARAFLRPTESFFTSKGLDLLQSCRTTGSPLFVDDSFHEKKLARIVESGSQEKSEGKMVSARGRLFIIFLAFVLIAQSINEVAGDDGVSDGDQDQGLLGLLFSPIKATLNGAKRLLGIPIKNTLDMVVDGFDEIEVQRFKIFTRVYNKTYNSREELRRRMRLFFERRRMIEQSVRDFAEGRLPFIMRENAFTDWDESEINTLTRASPPKSFEEMTEDERQVMLERRRDQSYMIESNEGLDQANGINLDLQLRPPGTESLVLAKRDNDSVVDAEHTDLADMDDSNMIVRADTLPSSKDWREAKCVATPRDQKKCGACYAIATMDALEVMRCINRNTSPILSPQQVIDCSTPRAGYDNHGCDGGWPTRVLKYLQDVEIAAREVCYPFVREQRRCKLRWVEEQKGCIVSSSPTNTRLTYRILKNEHDILYHVAKTGPVITVMKALDSFLFYSRGIYDDPKCSRRRDDVDHAILIVGYGRENGMDYWLIKNSWGTTDWGQGGYAKYRRGKNACSIGGWGWVITS
jgi:hypothetical protein